MGGTSYRPSPLRLDLVFNTRQASRRIGCCMDGGALCGICIVSVMKIDGLPVIEASLSRSPWACGAHLCQASGGDLGQIQFLLGHVSIKQANDTMAVSGASSPKAELPCPASGLPTTTFPIQASDDSSGITNYCSIFSKPSAKRIAISIGEYTSSRPSSCNGGAIQWAAVP